MKKLSIVHFIVIVLVLLSLSMNYAYFLKAGDFKSPIIEFEFIKNTADAQNIFTKENILEKDMIEGVDLQNKIDFAYMFFYSLFLVIVFIKISKYENKRIYFVGVFLAITAFFGDLFENIQLFNITDKLELNVNFSDNVKYLMLFTSVKWLSLALALFVLSFHYYKHKILGKIFSLLSFVPVIFAGLYCLNAGKQIELFFSLSIMVGFVILMIWVYVFRKKIF